MVNINIKFEILGRYYHINTNFKEDFIDVWESFLNILTSMLGFVNSLWILLFNNIIVDIIAELFMPRCLVYPLFIILLNRSDAGKIYDSQITQELYETGRISKKQFNKLEERIDRKYKV